MQDLRRSSITIRLGEDLLHALRVEAAKRPQSVNAEIVQRLVESLVRPPPTADLADSHLDTDERALVRMWRSMDVTEKMAMRTIANKLSDRGIADSAS